ncbi:hypothetical protein TNCV_2646781 [Trichonephila clavipes]|nr:hypothetical protein TNCV_2646781 [Trichonephila clavipes]
MYIAFVAACTLNSRRAVRPLVRLVEGEETWKALTPQFFKKRSVMSRRKQQSAFDQSSEFDRGSIEAYRGVVDYLSRKSVVVLDETKQL